MELFICIFTLIIYYIKKFAFCFLQKMYFSFVRFTLFSTLILIYALFPRMSNNGFSVRVHLEFLF
jgi:hypothetical protein